MNTKPLGDSFGLVHDIDYERVMGDMSLHGKMGGDILEALNADSTIVYAGTCTIR